MASKLSFFYFCLLVFGLLGSLSAQAPSARASSAKASSAQAPRDLFLLAECSKRIGSDERRSLQSQGLEVIGSYDAKRLIVRVDDFRFEGVEVDGVRFDGTRSASRRSEERVFDVQPGWKRAGIDSLATIPVQMKLHALLGHSLPPEQLECVDGFVRVQLVGFPGTPKQELRIVTLRHHGRVVSKGTVTVPTLIVDLPWDQIPAVASERWIMWIEPPLPALQPTNDTNRAVTGVDVVQALPFALDVT